MCLLNDLFLVAGQSFMEAVVAAKQPAKEFWRKWSVTVRVVPILAVVALLKFLAYQFDLEVLELNALFTSLVAGTIFLIGFLISGVLSDYKESEKIPSELAASLKTLLDDTLTIHKTKPSATTHQLLAFQQTLASNVLDWFYAKERTHAMLAKLSQLNDYFAALDSEGVPANYIIKMKNEQVNLRRMLMRVDTIRDTNFVKPAYTVVEVMGFLIMCGLITIKLNPFYMSLFFTLVVAFLVFYMLLLIKCLDNPFNYLGGTGGTEISLRPVREHKHFMDNFSL